MTPERDCGAPYSESDCAAAISSDGSRQKLREVSPGNIGLNLENGPNEGAFKSEGNVQTRVGAPGWHATPDKKGDQVQGAGIGAQFSTTAE
ncbi:MAG: hypothetical protein ACO3A4_04820 [Silvanigrellaceae bacterium]